MPPQMRPVDVNDPLALRSRAMRRFEEALGEVRASNGLPAFTPEERAGIALAARGLIREEIARALGEVMLGLEERPTRPKS